MGLSHIKSHVRAVPMGSAKEAVADILEWMREHSNVDFYVTDARKEGWYVTYVCINLFRIGRSLDEIRPHLGSQGFILVKFDVEKFAVFVTSTTNAPQAEEFRQKITHLLSST